MDGETWFNSTRELFDYWPPGISGFVYEDTDGDGVFSSGDTPLAGVQIDLSDGQSTTTDANGFYQFTGLLPGDYTITETDPPGYLSSGDVQGANDNSITVSLQSGAVVTGQDFSDYRRYTIFLPSIFKKAPTEP